MKQYIATSTDPPFRRKDKRNRFYSPTQKVQVYDAICDSGTSGITRPQIAQIVGLAPDRISFYLSELRRAGYIAVKGDPTTVSATMNADEAAFAAMLGLENALVARVREMGSSTPSMDAGFVKYSKIKELALRPGTGPEGKVALRMAILELVKLVF